MVTIYDVAKYAGVSKSTVSLVINQSPLVSEATRKKVQQAIADGDWEALADRIAFPIQFFDETYSYVIHDRDEFLDMVPQDDFEGVVFPDAFRERIGNASIEEYGSCVFGVTCLDHLIAFAGFGNDNTENDYRIRAISISTPLWPGRGESDPVLVVPPTPEP